MAPKAEQALRKQKEQKQKLLLLALAPVLLGLLAWQGPKTYKALTGGSAAPPPPPVTTTTTPTTTPAGTTTAPTSVTPNPTSATNLADTDPLLPPGTGQLVVFSRFVSKDPFRGKPTEPDTETTQTTTTSSSSPTADGATIEVNGSAEDVKIGGKFPAADAVFRLVAVGGQSAEIGLVTGEFSNGDKTMTVNVGETLVLVADPDGTRYAIKLISVG